jgi:hypothetical protein
MGWIGPEKHDFTAFDAEVATILDADPEALLFPRGAVSAPKWWLETHPEDRIVFDDGTFGRRHRTSLVSVAWRKSAGHKRNLSFAQNASASEQDRRPPKAPSAAE